MRFHLPGTLIALLIFQSSGALAEEVRYKSRSQPQTQERQSPNTQYKRQPDTPRERPPDKYHPIKEPPTRRPEPPSPPPDTPPPPVVPNDPWFPPPSCPPPGWDPIIVDPIFVPEPEPVLVPVPLTLEEAVSRRLRFLKSEGFVGQVVVGWDRVVLFERAYGNSDRPSGSGARSEPGGGYYDIGAVTRAFTAWAVYRLVESEELTLETTLGQLFPAAPDDKRRITIEQLLANTSGLENTYAADDETDRDAAVSRLLAQPLAHSPGQDFTYSDDGYVILAAAIEVASGMGYESYLWDSGVVSSDMRHTVFWGDVGPMEAHWGKRGSGGVLSTAHDLFRWTSRFLDQRDHTMEEIIRPRWTSDAGEGIGYGWFWTDPESEAPILWTAGAGDFDHNVIVTVYPNDAILVVTSDRFHGDVPWSERVANALEPILLRYEQPPVVRPMGDTTFKTSD